MKKVARFLAATTLAFSSLLLTTPAQAQDIWWAQESGEGDVVTITAPDGWQFVYARGWYGQPDNWDCGADVSNILQALMFEKTTVTLALDNNTFGDPCPGYFKVTRFTWGIVPIQPIIPVEPIPEPIPSPEPSPQPTPEPTIQPTPEITPPVIPVEPTPQPQPSDSPIPAPEPPTPPTNAPEPIPAPPAPEPAPEPPIIAPEPPAVAPEPPAVKPLPPVIEPIPEFVPEFIPESSPAQLMAEAQADDPVVPTELASIPFIGDAAVAVLEAFNAIGNIGADLTPEVRQQAQETIVASVLVSNIATTSMAATSSVASYRRK